MTATEHVILVDKNDKPLGTAEKLAAHQQGLCHRAFSVFIYRKSPKGAEILLQQRTLHKYHSPGLWTNTCCSHPRPGEDIVQAGQRRLREEMGISAPLRWVGSFHYIAHFENGLIENEVDHVLIGLMTDSAFQVNSNEVQDYRWVNVLDLKKELHLHPVRFTAWLKEALTMAEKKL
jgi:isopentenyl-diphosphate delta-isomerase type 1